MMEVLSELSYLFRPYADMYLFHVLDAYILGREASAHFMAIAALFFVLSLFYLPEHRHGARLYGRLLFVLIILSLMVYQVHGRSDRADD